MVLVEKEYEFLNNNQWQNVFSLIICLIFFQWFQEANHF